jgi:hypothetical protein
MIASLFAIELLNAITTLLLSGLWHLVQFA